MPGLLPHRPARHRTGQPVTAADLATAQHWPQFAAAARHAGFTAVQALPMRLREQVTGTLNLYRATPGPFDPADVRVGQADVTTISLLRDAARSRNLRLSDLARALVDGTETHISLTTGPRHRPSTGRFHGAKAASKSGPAV